jgi:hypothetical protein
MSLFNKGAKVNPAAERVADERGGVKTLEQFEAEKIDPVKLAAELSHELEQAREEIEVLQGANREWHVMLARAEAARDILKDLRVEAMRR